MTLIFCVDDNFGMMFNNRRQSRDSAVLDDLKINFEKVYISAYSEKIFSETNIEYEVCEDFLSCDKNAVYFIEDKYSPDLLNLADEIILYHWGKVYPADLMLDINILSADFTLYETHFLTGNSHKEIKKERYAR